MDPLALAKALADLGGWGAFLALAVALAVAVIRGWLVPGRYFDREVARGDKADLAATRNAESIERLTASIDTIVEKALREQAEQRAWRA